MASIKFPKISYLITAPFLSIVLMGSLILILLLGSEFEKGIESSNRTMVAQSSLLVADLLFEKESKPHQFYDLIVAVAEKYGHQLEESQTRDQWFELLESLVLSQRMVHGIFIYNKDHLVGYAKGLRDRSLRFDGPIEQVDYRVDGKLYKTMSLQSFMTTQTNEQDSSERLIFPFRAGDSTVHKFAIPGSSIWVMIESSWDRFSTRLKESTEKLGMLAYVVDEDGVIHGSSRLSDREVNAFQARDCLLRCPVHYLINRYGSLQVVPSPQTFSFESLSGTLLIGVRPVSFEDHRYLAISVDSESSWKNIQLDSTRITLQVTIVAIVLVILSGLLLGRSFTSFTESLRVKMDQMSNGEWVTVSDFPRKDELGYLEGDLIKLAGKWKNKFDRLQDIVDKKVSEQEQLVEKYARSNRELERSIATKDRFFSIIAHDLKSPFMALKGYSCLIDDSFDSLPKTQLRTMIRKIAVSSEETHGLLENLLQWAMIQNGRIRVKWETFPIKEVVLEVFDLMKVNARVKNISLIDRLEDNVWVKADRNMVSTIIRNLVSNSIKFTNSNEGYVEVYTEISDDKIMVFVKDNGVGITEENIHKLFARDIYFTKKGTSNESGTGLGLSLCNEFAVMNKGQISVNSVVDQGTTFGIALLKANAKTNLELVTDHDDDVIQKVLCVDDSQDNHNLIEIFLNKTKWELVSVYDGSEAVELLKQESFSVILMDINMPIMNGIEATTLIREMELKDSTRSRAQIIAFTSSVLQEDIDAAVTAGCDSYLVKPIKKQKLINAIVRHSEKARGSSS